jgi:hypothetical protein
MAPCSTGNEGTADTFDARDSSAEAANVRVTMVNLAPSSCMSTTTKKRIPLGLFRDFLAAFIVLLPTGYTVMRTRRYLAD